MPFIISDTQHSQNEQPQIVPGNTPQSTGFAKQLLTSGMKLAAIPAARVKEELGGAVGGLIETPSALTSAGYQFFGQEPPEWTQHPAEIRLTESGEIKPELRTPQEIREFETKPKYGEYTEPTNAIEDVISEGSSIIANLGLGGVRGGKALAKGAATILGTRKSAKAFGIPDQFEIPLEMATSHVALTRHGGKYEKPNLSESTAKGRELAQTAQQESISHAPASILAEGKKDSTTRFLKWAGKAGEEVRDRAQSFVQEIQQSTEGLLSDIYQPYRTEKNLKILHEKAGQMFKPVNDLAAQNPVPLDHAKIISSVDKNITKIKSSKSLAPGEKAALKVLEDFKDEIEKGLTLENGVDTYRSFNKHIKNWDSITKNDIHLIDVKKELERQILESGKNIPNFNDAFTVSNIGYHNLNKLENSIQLLKKAYTDTGAFDPKNFVQLVKNPENRSELERLMGKNNLDRMTKISHLTESGLKSFAEVGALLPEDLRIQGKTMTQAMGLGNVLTQPFSAAAAPFKSLSAKILTNPDLQRNYLGYLKAAKDNSKKLAAFYFRQIKQELEKNTDQEQTPDRGFIIE